MFKKLLQALGVVKKPEPEQMVTSYNVATYDDGGRRIMEFHCSRRPDRPAESANHD